MSVPRTHFGRVCDTELVRASDEATQPLQCDPYRRKRDTGGFFLIDESTNRTVGAGMVT